MEVKLAEALKRPFLLGDGANGTWLSDQGFKTQPYELANLHAPELVIAAHQAYIDAGSDFVETNTFSANEIKMPGSSHLLHDLTLAGAHLARKAAGPEKLVLGCIGPMGKPIEPIGSITRQQVFDAVRKQAIALAESNEVDGFILETFINLEELAIAVEAVKSVSDLPIIACKAFIEDGEALAEGLPGRCATEMTNLGVAAIGANCVVGPQRMVDIVRQLSEYTDLPVLAQPTPGLPQLVKGEIVYDIQPEYFAKACMRLVEEGAHIIGGCCGTTPEHIARMRSLLDAGAYRPQARTSVERRAKEQKPLAETEPTELAMKLKNGKFIITVEMDLPRGLNVDKILRGSKSLKVHGADLVDISDGARARLRMNPMSVATLIQDKVGMEVMMHFSCRDRNLLAIQADLLGAHALGVRNILAITGDPANIGDYPSATSVFDIDAIGLVRILSRFNEGIDLAGYSIGVKCGFVIGVAFDPIARDFDSELDRLKRKADAGAHVVYTQPLFERQATDVAAEACHKVGLPLFVGILPLRNVRHCEFMHNEVPGIVIPDWLRKAMADAPDDDNAREVGICEAQKLSAHIRTQSQGLYLMPPFGSHQIAERVMEAVL